MYNKIKEMSEIGRDNGSYYHLLKIIEYLYILKQTMVKANNQYKLQCVIHIIDPY